MTPVITPTRPFTTKEELNLLAKLIGGNEGDNGGGRDTFKLNLFDICGGGGGGVTEKHGLAFIYV